jgi:antirestriction protein ArdC
MDEAVERRACGGRITRPLRGNGVPYQGINVLMLWGAAMEQGCSAPIWLTVKQALGGSVRKGQHGGLVVFASTFTRTEANEATGEELERDVPFLKGYARAAADRYVQDRKQNVSVVETVVDLERHLARKP